MPGAGLGLVLLREAVRQSRRRTTWMFRVAFAGAVVASLLIGSTLAVDSMTDPSHIGEVGQILFLVYSGLQLILVACIAPVLVATGVLEEKDDRTLEMLVITRLGASDILWGKVGSRLLTLLTLVLGGLPVLALVLSLGGVAPWQVINTTSATALVALVLGVVAGFVALFSRGPQVPVTAALLFGLVVMGLLPAALGRPHHVFSPAIAAYETSATGLLVWIPWTLVLLQIGHLGAPVLRIITTDDSTDEFGKLSPDIWVLERFQRRTALAWLLAVAGWMGSGLVSSLLTIIGFRWANTVMVVWTGAWSVALVFAASTSFLLGALRLVLAGRRRATERARVVAARAELTGRQRRVWRNPVLWKEATAAQLQPGRAALFGAAWLVLLALAGTARGDVVQLLAALMGVLSLLAAGPLAAAPAIEDRRLRTLPLLLLTPLASWRILIGKVLGPLARLVVLVALVYVTWLAGTTDEWLVLPGAVAAPWTHLGPCTHAHLLGPNLGRGHLLTVAALGGWHVSLLLLLATIAVTVATLVPRTLAWPSVAVVTVAWAVGPLVVGTLAQVLSLPRPTWLLYLWLPPGVPQSGFGCPAGGAPRWILVVTLGQILGVGVLGATASAALERLRWRPER